MAGPEFISIPEWARRMGVSKESAYKAPRTDQIPSCFAIGKLWRVNWSAFVERNGSAGGHQLAEEVGGIAVLPFDHVGVDTKSGRRIGVA